MAVSLASRLREKFGEETFVALEQWVKDLIRSEGVSRDEYREILSRLDLLDKGYLELKEEVYRLRSEMREEINNLRGEINSLRGEMREEINGLRNEVRGEINSLRGEVNTRLDNLNARLISSIKWTVGTIALFGTIITILMAIFKFAG